MKSKLLVLAIILFSFSSQAQIPENWEGHYAGDLHVTQLSGFKIDYKMELIFYSIDDSTYQWTIVYGEDSTRQERKYFLKWKGENNYVIDEDNSIILSSNLFDNEFISVFEVQGNLIHVVYRFEKNKVYFDLTMSKNRSETGNGEVENSEEEIPIVYSYTSSTSQHAILKRIKKKKKK